MDTNFHILIGPNEVGEFVSSCQKAADTERVALGFLPEGVYQNAADQGKLLVAVSLDGHYLGHLMFGGVFPHAKVMQTYCLSEYRHLGIGKKLIQKLIKWAEERGYLNISARVAADLDVANSFYESVGFQTVRTGQGGKVRNRTILTKVLDLDTPSLLDLMGDRRRAGSDHLGLSATFSNQTAVYAIDLNVLFDISKKRVREREAKEVLKAALNHQFHVALTEEFPTELLRTSYGRSGDFMLDLCKLFSILPTPKSKKDKGRLDDLQLSILKIVFPDRYHKGVLSKQDLSDASHLALCIINDAKGFITSEKAILRARDRLLEDFRLDILSVTDFADNLEYGENKDHGVRVYSSGSPDIAFLDSSKLSAELLEEFLENLHLPQDLKSQFWDGINGVKGSYSRAAMDGENLVAVVNWIVERSPRLNASLLIVSDEASTNVKSIVDGLLGDLCNKLSQSGPVKIKLEMSPGQPKTREMALSLGFRPDDYTKLYGTIFHKISFGGCVTKDTWGQFRSDLITIAGIKLPEKMPSFQGDEQEIDWYDNQGELRSITLTELENLLSPLILLLPGRDGVILPLKRGYADDLLATSDQLSLLGAHAASIRTSRVYYCKPNKTIKPGLVAVFYESSNGGGRGAAVAIAKISQVRKLSPVQIAVETNSLGVLDHSELGRIGSTERKLTILCSNIAKFNNIVRYKKLVELGCDNRARFVTSTAIGYRALLGVISEGGINGSNR